MVEGGGDASRLFIHRNKKFSTTSLIHGVEYHFKTNTNVATVKLVCRCSKRPGAIVPFILMKGATVTRRKEHRCMSFFAKTPKAENIVTKPRAKKSLSDHRRFIPSSTTIWVPKSHTLNNGKQNFHRFNKPRGSPDCQRSTSTNQTREGGADAFKTMSTATKFSTI
jgi:hypothetical protein